MASLFSFFFSKCFNDFLSKHDSFDNRKIEEWVEYANNTKKILWKNFFNNQFYEIITWSNFTKEFIQHFNILAIININKCKIGKKNWILIMIFDTYYITQFGVI